MPEANKCRWCAYTSARRGNLLRHVVAYHKSQQAQWRMEVRSRRGKGRGAAAIASYAEPLLAQDGAEQQPSSAQAQNEPQRVSQAEEGERKLFDYKRVRRRGAGKRKLVPLVVPDDFAAVAKRYRAVVGVVGRRCQCRRWSSMASTWSTEGATATARTRYTCSVLIHSVTRCPRHQHARTRRIFLLTRWPQILHHRHAHDATTDGAVRA